jgi:hypothetical protein
MSDPVLVVAWLVFAHLVADFVLQNDWIAMTKGTGGRSGWSALLVHGFHVSLCLAPAVLAFGAPGLAYLVLVTVSHMLIDQWKVRATRRAEAGAQDQARRRVAASGEAPPSGLGAAWTPMPGLLFVADQALHMTFAIAGWLVILEGATLVPAFVDFADAAFRAWDRGAVHAAILTGVVIVSLFIVNTRGAYYFVLTLVSPREIAPAPAPHATAAAPATAPTGYTVRVGPLVATVEPSPGPGEAVPAEARDAGGRDAAPARATDPSPSVPSVPNGAPARIGATIGALERLLIVALLLTGAEAAVGFVIAAKTIARFKQLDDRGFAEYYLLGTLASVSVALGSGLLAQAALRSLG